MAKLQLTGPIAMQDVNVILSKPPTTNTSLNDADVREIAEIPSGIISLNDLYGKGPLGALLYESLAGRVAYVAPHPDGGVIVFVLASTSIRIGWHSETGEFIRGVVTNIFTARGISAVTYDANNFCMVINGSPNSINYNHHSLYGVFSRDLTTYGQMKRVYVIANTATQNSAGTAGNYSNCLCGYDAGGVAVQPVSNLNPNNLAGVVYAYPDNTAFYFTYVSFGNTPVWGLRGCVTSNNLWLTCHASQTTILAYGFVANSLNNSFRVRINIGNTADYVLTGNRPKGFVVPGPNGSFVVFYAAVGNSIGYALITSDGGSGFVLQQLNRITNAELSNLLLYSGNYSTTNFVNHIVNFTTSVGVFTCNLTIGASSVSFGTGWVRVQDSLAATTTHIVAKSQSVVEPFYAFNGQGSFYEVTGSVFNAGNITVGRSTITQLSLSVTTSAIAGTFDVLGTVNGTQVASQDTALTNMGASTTVYYTAQEFYAK